MTISLPSEIFEQQITERLASASQSAKLPGFRPGKVPMREIRRRYGSAVRAEIAGELMQSSFVEAIRSEDLSPAASPQLEVLKMDPGIDFEFTATFEIFPVVELVDFDCINLKKPEASILDSDIDETIIQLQEQRKQWDEINDKCVDQDRVTVDFEGKIEGEPFEGGSGEGVAFVVGAKQMIENFDEAIVGMTPGEEKVFDALFPEDYQAEELQGKTASFTVTLNKLERPKLPELDDSFFREFGVETGEMEDFRTEVTKTMEKDLAQATRAELRRQIIDALHELNEVQLPGSMVKSEVDLMKQQMMQQFQMYGGDGNDTPELPDEMFEEQAKKRVAVGLIIRQIVSNANLTADNDKVMERIQEIATQYPEPEKVVNYYYSNQEQLHQIENMILEEQVIDNVLEEASVEVVDSAYREIIEGRALQDTSSDDE